LTPNPLDETNTPEVRDMGLNPPGGRRNVAGAALTKDKIVIGNYAPYLNDCYRNQDEKTNDCKDGL